MSDFDDSLREGKIGESQIAEWFKDKGHHVLPVYEKEKGEFSGPAVYTSDGGSIIAPDMIVFGKGRTAWVEAKHKSAFTWHRITGEWTTGIDLHHYHEYLKIMDLIEWPVWIMFLHKDGKEAPHSPKPSPTGLYGNSLFSLSQNIHHEWPGAYGHQKHGMIYWSINSLVKLSNYPL
jgi:hypothetical protein